MFFSIYTLGRHTTSISRSCSKSRKETETNECLTGSKSRKGKSTEGRVPASRRMLLDCRNFKGMWSTLTEGLSCIFFTFHLDHGITTRLRQGRKTLQGSVWKESRHKEDQRGMQGALSNQVKAAPWRFDASSREEGIPAWQALLPHHLKEQVKQAGAFSNQHTRMRSPLAICIPIQLYCHLERHVWLLCIELF